MNEREDILKSAIEKAGKQGWVDSVGQPRNPSDTQVDARNGYFRHIFNHHFARAFFGEEPYRELVVPDQKDIGRIGYRQKFEPAWKYHLQVMVLEADPITYLAKFI